MARAIVLSETSDSQDIHEDEGSPESEEGEEDVAPLSDAPSSRRVAFCTLDSIRSDGDEVRRSLMQRATKREGMGHVGSVAWQGDGTPSNEGNDSDLSIQDAVRQLAQRYEGPREFWTESSLPTITRDSLPSAIHSAMATREQLPVMNEELQSGHPTHPSSPSSDDDTTGPSMMASSESDEPSGQMYHIKRMKKLRRAMMSKESLPTIFSESANSSEFGSRVASRRGSRQVSRCHTREMLPDIDFDMPSGFKMRTTTKDSLPPIGDELEPDSDSESDNSGPDKEAVDEHTAASASRGSDSLCAADVAEQLRLAQQQISALRNELDALRRNNADLQHENAVLRTLATKSESLRELAGVANNPKRRPPPAQQSQAQGSSAPPDGRRFSDPGFEPGPAASSDLRQSSETSTLTAKELWQKRRQERKERLSNADSGGKLSYRRWLQDQHELMAVAPPKKEGECTSPS